MMNSSKLLLVLPLLASVAGAAKPVEDTVAVVNGSPILLSEYQKEAATAIDFWSKSQPGSMDDPSNVRKLRESTLEQLIDRELLYQEGVKLKLKVREREIENAVEEIKSRFRKDDEGKDLTPAEAEENFRKQLKAEGLDLTQFRERLSRQIMARKVIEEGVKAKVVPPTLEEAKAYFAKIESYLAQKTTDTPKGMDEEEAMALREVSGQVKALSSERVRVQRILIRLSPGASDAEKRRALRTAQDIKKKLDGGADFGAVAREESEDPESAARGGDIGFVLRGVASPDLEKAAFTLPVGEASAPILTEVGYHIIRVTERRAAEKPDFERFKDDIVNFRGQMAFQRDLERFVKGLREKAHIERNLPAATVP
ncbi:MAG: peptidylprolyl isomerase [Elusimicrobiota bacterium]|nr:peptidylprolyl isomerase [Elusimicrobiota bacterium]